MGEKVIEAVNLPPRPAVSTGAPIMTTTPIKLPVEVRFPLDLGISIPSIRQLYEDGKRDAWSPERAISWNTFDGDAFSEEQRDAGRLVWSRRAWLEYTGIAETPALLLRFCMERAREADPKYFLTVRNTEEAVLVESCERYAELLGGYLDRPAESRWEEVINRSCYRHALDAEVSLDAYVATHCAVEDGLELELFRAHLANATEPVARAILEKAVQGKARHAQFGWSYLHKRAGEMTARERSAVVEGVVEWFSSVACDGYHVPSLSTTIDSRVEQRAQAVAADAGLGTVSASREEEILRSCLATVRARFLDLGLRLPPLAHPHLGGF